MMSNDGIDTLDAEPNGVEGTQSAECMDNDHLTSSRIPNRFNLDNENIEGPLDNVYIEGEQEVSIDHAHADVNLGDDNVQDSLHDLHEDGIIGEDETQGHDHVCAKLIQRIIELQSLWDEYKLKSVQDKMLRILFGDLGSPGVSNTSCKSSLAKILMQFPSTWQDDLGGIQVPACWDQLQTMLKGLGMVCSQRYRVCTGSQMAMHPPELLYPSQEDNYFGDIPRMQTMDCIQEKALPGEVYKVDEYVVVKVDDRSDPSHHCGHWKVHIKSIFSMQHKNKIMVFFAGEYYKQCIVGDNSESLSIGRITSMNIIEKRPLSINWDSIRPISSLLHKFIPLPLPKSQKLIAYEIKDLKIRDTLLHEGCIGNAPLWLEYHDIVKVRVENQESIRFQYAVVRETNPNNLEAKLGFLVADRRHPNIWRVQKEDEKWLDMDCSQSFLDSLLSKPREEALRLLDLWRDSQPKDLCIEKVHESVEWKPLNGNEWFTSIGPIQDLRNNPKEKEKVSSIIKENAKNVQTLIVDGIPYKWEEDDIYAYVIKSLATKRKWRKQKSTGSNTSSTTNSIVDNIITKSDSHNIEEEMQELENCASVLKMVFYYPMHGDTNWKYVIDVAPRATRVLQSTQELSTIDDVNRILDDNDDDTSEEGGSFSDAKLEYSSTSTDGSASEPKNSFLNAFELDTNTDEIDTFSHSSIGLNLEIVLEIDHEDLYADITSVL
ncbi:hypothetical protein L7F22_035782 [Adiantum nelumboides]|nr:hypothetical protein [Adiantum nelumboides]